MHSHHDTIVAIATPIGESGLGIVRLSGSAAIALVSRLFTSRKSTDLSQAPSHTCHVGDLAGETPIDQVVISLFRAPNSYTGDDVVEISAHGSPFILNQIQQACVQAGARLAEPGEFTQRAFLAGKIDLTQAEAVADLIRAKTDQSHAAALAQLDGHLAKEVRFLRDQLLPLLAHVEVGLDHSDEDHAFLSRTTLITQCQSVQQKIQRLLASARVGKILREGLRVALVGRPNVGKSSLLNALLKEERAIVTPIPGTTRDTVEESVNWEGIPVVLTDTAGVRRATLDPVERLGIERTRQALQSADVVLCVFDASEPLTDEDDYIQRQITSKPHICVMNKIDLDPHPPPLIAGAPSPAGRGGPTVMETLSLRERVPSRELRETEGEGIVYVSAKTGEGLQDLVHAVKDMALGGQAVSGEARWNINARHQAALHTAHESLNEAVKAAQQEAYEECVAFELQSALKALGEIIGETATEDLLEQIFSKFCIGK